VTGPDAAGVAAAAPAPALAGSLRVLPFAELLRSLEAARATGVLELVLGPRPAAERKAIWLRDGQVVFAASTDPADHLGAILWRRGVALLPDLEKLAQRVGPGRMLGQVLLEEDLLSPAALYDALVEQVREIVLGAFHELRGDFAFHEHAAPRRTEVALPERTAELVAAGLRRVADVERLGADVPDPDAVVAAPAGLPPGLEGRAARLLATLDGARTAREAFRASGLGFHDGMKVLATLARAGLVSGPPLLRRRAAPAGAAEAVDDLEPFENYRRVFRRIFFRLAHAAPDAGARLDSWFERLDAGERALFEGVRVGSEGDLDATRVLLNVFAEGRDEGPQARARAVAALESFLRFALFLSRELLAADDAAALAADVARMQGRRAA
jgi:hypothetical protein